MFNLGVFVGRLNHKKDIIENKNMILIEDFSTTTFNRKNKSNHTQPTI